MRINDFVTYIRTEFRLWENFALAETIAQAMYVAERDHAATFKVDGVVYAIYSDWYDGCISGDCNPATCYTDWMLLWQQT